MNRSQNISHPDLGQLLGLMLAGAAIGVTVFGIALAVFDVVRDRTGLHWSSELLGLLALFLVLSTAVTVLACCLLGHLIRVISQRAVASALMARLPIMEPEASQTWTLREAPPSVSEHTTYKMKDPVPRDRT